MLYFKWLNTMISIFAKKSIDSNSASRGIVRGKVEQSKSNSSAKQHTGPCKQVVEQSHRKTLLSPSVSNDDLQESLGN